MAPRDLSKHDDLVDKTDLLIIDGFRIAGMVWLLIFFAAQYTMAGILFNPWTLQDFFKTNIFTLVYSANMIIDEIFMLSAFFTYIKLRRMSFG